jgi:hypothetical protein
MLTGAGNVGRLHYDLVRLVMARPLKYTVEYFPHLCKQGKTMYILESRYGNDGYAFWFKLLEILATTEGHYFIADNDEQWEFLGAKTRFPTQEMGVILGLLAKIDAIDKELWEEHKLIWCQKLVENVADVYENRTGLLPEKPYYDGVILHQNIDNHNNNPIKLPHNTQTKLKETKLKETKYNIYGEFKNVKLSEIEYGKLIERYGEKRTGVMIESLSAYMKSKNKRYKSHYATILNWFRMDEAKNPPKKVSKHGDGW